MCQKVLVFLIKLLLLDSSLDDIKYVLNPTFDKAQISQLDKSDKLSRAIDGSFYSPGIVGMNNIKANDYCNVILQVSSFQIFFSLALYYYRRITIKDFRHFLT